MTQHVNALLVGLPSDLSAFLIDLIEPQLYLEDHRSTKTLLQGLRACEKEVYDICLVADSFEPNNLQGFFRDVKKIPTAEHTVFIQIKEKLPPDFDYGWAKELGFNTVVSLRKTAKDREEIQEVLQGLQSKGEIARRIRDVESAMDLVLKQIDQVAEDRRRGRASEFNTISTDWCVDRTEYDEAVLNNYFETLEEQTEEAAPAEATEIEVPEKVLTKKLPYLEKNRYTGVSSRVWRKLLKKHGKGRKDEEHVTSNKEVTAETPDPAGSEELTLEPSPDETTLEDSADAPQAPTEETLEKAPEEEPQE